MTTTDPQTIDPTDHDDIVNRNLLAVGRMTDPTGTMSEAEAARLRDHVPDDPVSLPKGKIACAMCGITVDYPKTRAALIKVPRFAAKTNDKAGAHLGNTLLSRCATCQDRRQLALRIAADHPAAGAQLGGVVVDVIENVLVALVVLGKPLPTPDISYAELGSMIRTLSTAGRTATWRSIAADRPGQCSRRAYGHVRQATRTILTRAYMDFFAESLKMRRPPVAVPPPPARSGEIKINGGCLMCGIGSVPVNALRVHRLGGPAGAAQTVWRQVEGIAPTSIGGPGTPDRLSGAVCPDCSDAVSSAGGVGVSALEISLARHLERLGDDGTAAVVRAGEWRVIGWGGLVARARAANRPDPAPSKEPWGHVTLDVPRSGAGGELADHPADPTMLEAS